MEKQVPVLVHIDMKGGPPTLDYLLQLLPLFKSWGATGILIEWEDMFPYSGMLKVPID
jgi:hexosaminidase